MHWRKYALVTWLAVREAASYRLNHILSFVVGAVPLIAMLLLWDKVVGAGEKIAGMGRGEVLTYFIVTRWLYEIAAPTVWWDITSEIREGDLVFHLLRPQNYGLYHFAVILGSKLPYGIIGLGVVAPFALSIGQSWAWPPSALAWLGFGASALLSMVLGYQLTFLLSLSAFWLEETDGVALIADYVIPLAAGAVLPLSLFPKPIAAALEMLPFAKILFFPAQVYLGMVGGKAIAAGLAEQAAWIVALWALNAWVWRMGLRRFRAVGG